MERSEILTTMSELKLYGMKAAYVRIPAKSAADSGLMSATCSD